MTGPLKTPGPWILPCPLCGELVPVNDVPGAPGKKLQDHYEEKHRQKGLESLLLLCAHCDFETEHRTLEEMALHCFFRRHLSQPNWERKVGWEEERVNNKFSRFIDTKREPEKSRRLQGGRKRKGDDTHPQDEMDLDCSEADLKVDLTDRKISKGSAKEDMIIDLPKIDLLNKSTTTQPSLLIDLDELD